MMDMNNINIDDSFFFKGNLAENLVIMRELIKNKTKIEGSDYEDVYAYGYNFFTAGQYEKAKDIFKILILAGQDNVKGYIALGACLQKLNRLDNAATIYSAAHLIEPHNYIVLFNLGLCYFNQEKFVESESAFLYACIMGYKTRLEDKQKIYQMSQKLWKISRNKQGKDVIEIEQSLIQVD